MGSGKTFLTATVIRRLRRLELDGPRTVAFHFCDGVNENSQVRGLADTEYENKAAYRVIRIILRQILKESPELPRWLLQKYIDCHDAETDLGESDILDILIEGINQHEEIYIVIDALDELLSGSVTLLKIFSMIMEESKTPVALFLSCREGEVNLKERITRLGENIQKLSICENDSGDIGAFLDEKLDVAFLDHSFRALLKKTDKTRKQMKKKLLNDTGNM